MRIYRRGKVWWYQWRGERASLGVTDKPAAEAAFRELQRKFADPNHVPEDTTTLGEAYASFYAKEVERERAPGTLRRYGSHLGHFNRVWGSSARLADLGAKALDAYVSLRLSEGAERATVYQELVTMRGILKLARRQGHYPFELDTVMPVIDLDSKPLERRLELEQARMLLAYLEPERAAVCAFILTFGADWHSVELAKRGDVDLEAGTALIRGSKNSYRWRTIPVLEPVAEFAPMALPPFTPWGNVVRDLAVACRNLELPRVTPRDLRRSCGYILRAAGVEPHLIGAMLGHADSTMAERVYAKLQPQDLAKLARAQIQQGTK